MPHWEYLLIVDQGWITQSDLTRWGKAGWEVVSAKFDENGWPSSAILKRLKEPS